MNPFKSICFTHFQWNCRICKWKNKVQALESAVRAESPVGNASPQSTSNSATTEAAFSSTNSSGGSENIKQSTPVSTSASTGNSTYLIGTASTSSGNQVVQQGEKRKQPEVETDATVASTSSKRIKVSYQIVDCEVASEVLSGINWIDHRFLNSGKVLAWALQPDDPAFLRINEYVANTQIPEIPIKILSILRIMPRIDKLGDDSPLDFSDHPNTSEMCRKMLWHGTKSWNVSSILENGLREPYANRGVYFSDSIYVSSEYCDFFGSAKYLFLSDVLLGKKGDWDVDECKTRVGTVGNIKCHSHKYCGPTIPDKMNKEVDGCIWPYCGDINDIRYLIGSYYIIHNSEQVRPKYLLKVEF